ncbi:uncharacterized protein LOC115882305 isoform X2 [Sitophilus oryzae]|uniref:Uncharacterized protein LOC115882305 isoform X1 n=1 Tax=Sitophilus oryzae TaxID=7048 RepID=A0A6J2XZF7_SITOR|nr:uncharacterized protein LOC115882305 isoform X1 [Sitophilus oryzae]XP_030756150.1 uncharacterized protein LOC115882305 isoform X2 [Sitophilus oryzae]
MCKAACDFNLKNSIFVCLFCGLFYRISYICILYHNICIWKLIQALPDNGRHIRSRLEKLLLEAHQRRFWICLEELHSIFEYNAKRREYVERWMRNFDVNNQEEIELDKITQDCKRSRSLPRYIPNYYHYTVCRPSR